MQNMGSERLSELSLKELKEYIASYQLPSKMALEKSDLVSIIFNTRPISNDNEQHYRRNRQKKAIPTSELADNDKKSFSFSNMMQELFTPNSNCQESNNNTSYNEQQRREQESRRILQEQRQRQEQNRRMQQQTQQRTQRQQREQYMRQQQQQQQQQQREREQQHQRQREQYMRQQEQQRQREGRHYNPPQPSSPPIPNSENLLSLHDMVKAKIDPASLSVRTLKSILKANYVEQSHVIEKSELVKLVIRLVDSYKTEHANNDGSDSGTSGTSGNEDTMCRICMDAQQNCVFLDCGHMVTCMECAKKLIESKNECPICREPILKLVHVFRS
ncbi:zinc finger, C3HC4 type-domain-containing protein [Parasitella parasitica]|nr:zinc finger, C3HC4 type-domain-containing protein [Parasitella parasitica]